VSEPNSKISILVADDSAISRKLIEHSLSGKDYSLLFAKSGQEAIELFTKHGPAIVIVDWMMPDLTGIEICRHVRSAQNPYTYVVMPSAPGETGWSLVRMRSPGSKRQKSTHILAGDSTPTCWRKGNRPKVGIRLIEFERNLELALERARKAHHATTA
jgi:CheY-like chemotaxis protein